MVRLVRIQRDERGPILGSFLPGDTHVGSSGSCLLTMSCSATKGQDSFGRASLGLCLAVVMVAIVAAFSEVRIRVQGYQDAKHCGSSLAWASLGSEQLLQAVLNLPKAQLTELIDRIPLSALLEARTGEEKLGPNIKIK